MGKKNFTVLIILIALLAVSILLMSVSLRTVHRIHASALQKFPAPD